MLLNSDETDGASVKDGDVGRDCSARPLSPQDAGRMRGCAWSERVLCLIV